MNRKRILLIVAVYTCAAAGTHAQTKFAEARTALDKWVETRQLISKEKSEWEMDKQTLEQQVNLLEKENQLLDEQIAKAEATTTQADKEKQKLIEDNEALSVASTAMSVTVAQLEKRLLEIVKAFPPPLMERIEPLYRRVPTKPENVRLSVSERMQNVIGIISEVDKFNNAITVVSEVKKNGQGVDVQVKTIYLGLAAGYFADKAQSFAGVGTPGGDGWQWTPQNNSAASIGRAIHVYENAAAAVFVELPVTIK